MTPDDMEVLRRCTHHTARVDAFVVQFALVPE